MPDRSISHAKYWTLGIAIALLSSVLLPTQTLESLEESSVDSDSANDDRVHAQSPGHFRFGHINWNRTGNVVEFRVLDSFTRTDYSTNCVNPITMALMNCTGPGGFAGVGEIIRENVAPGGTELFFGDGSDSGILNYMVDSINLAEDTLFAHAVNLSRPDRKILHTYSGLGPFVAKIDDADRNAAEENNDGLRYRVATTVNLSQTNQSPVSTLSPVVVCPVGICSFPIPATDPDADALNFRLSTSTEAGSAFFEQPGQGTAQPLTVSSSGIVTWNTAGFQNVNFCSTTFDLQCLYSTSITIEEIKSGTNASSVMVDFLINIAAPSFVPPTPPNGSTFNIIVGVTLPLLLNCTDPNVGENIQIGHLGLPADATLSPSVPGNPATRIFTFSPAVIQTVSVTFTCTDPKGNSATPRTININVTPAPPRVVKTVHAEKHNFATVRDGIPFIVDMTIIGEIYEDLNTQLVMKEQAIVVTCLKLPNQATVHECNATSPPADVVPVSNCTEIPFNGIHTMNTIVKGSTINSMSQEMNTVAKGFLVKTIHVQKEVFECTYDNEDPTDDVRVDLVVFTEIFENLSKITQTPPQDPIIKTNFISFRCVTSLETLEVQSCLFEQLFD